MTLPGRLRAMLGWLATAGLVGCGTVRPPAGGPDVELDGGIDVPAPMDIPPFRDLALDGPGADATDAPPSDRGPDAPLDASGDVPTDARPDVPMDATVGDPCGTGAVVDLATMGTRAGATTTYSGTTVGLPELSRIPGDCILQVGYEVALRYVVGARSHLRVSTQNPGTATTFDTIVWVIDRCEPGATALGCGDNAVPGKRRTNFTTPTALAAGAVVYIIVGGTTPPYPGNTATGPFQLTVTEVTELPAGNECDPTGVANVCPPDAHCLTDALPALCVPDGIRGGQCRAPPPGCDTGLSCNGDRLEPASRCVPVRARGEACDPMRHADVCAPGTNCLNAGLGPVCS